jgi:two-component system sensor histidine kinase/response regulator
MNRSALTLTALNLREAVGQAAQQVFPTLSDVFARYDGNHEMNEEIRFGAQYFEGQLYPLENSGKRRVGHLLKLNDITTRKEAEAEREQLISDLNAYAHTVAHDLKTPISILMGYSELILDSDVNMPEAESRLYLETISKTSFRMYGIIDDLLLLSSIRTQTNVPAQPLDMRGIVTSVVQRLEPMLKDSDAKVTLQPEMPLAVGHAGWLEQVWANYISNAIKYGGRPPEIVIGAEAQGERVRFWVRDNGIGLNAEQQSRLFKEFSRVSESAMEGHGLGLSIVRRIVEKLGGQVGVESALGKGSTFFFSCPVWIFTELCIVCKPCAAL